MVTTLCAPQVLALQLRCRVTWGTLLRQGGSGPLCLLSRPPLSNGSRVTRPGGGVYVPARKYTWTAGPDGAEFLEIFAGSPTGTII